jgi:hypothetical protein
VFSYGIPDFSYGNLPARGLAAHFPYEMAGK